MLHWVHPEKTSRLVQLFLQGSRSWQTDRLTDHATRSVTTGCIYVHSTEMRPNKVQYLHSYDVKIMHAKSPGPRPSSIPSHILIHAAIWPQQIWAENWGVCAPLGEGELGSHLTQCGQGRGLRACQVSSWSVEPFVHNTPTLQTDMTDNGPIA